MTRGPYRRAPRRHLAKTTHQVGDVLLVGNVRWIIQQITGTDVVLEAANASPSITWHTTATNLPAPLKELS